jgi:glycosidase
MKVMMFYNLGYASNKADFFTKACADFSAGRDTPERNWFVFSHSDTAPKPNGWTWVQCAPDAYYLEYWGVNAPAYDWTNPAWQAKAKQIIQFWMDMGTDGMSFDAPPAYYGITQSAITTYISDALNSYGGLGYAEGVGVNPDWVTNYHFPALEDYNFSAQWTRPTPVANAIFTHDPSALEGTLNTSRDRAVNAGGILWSPIEWDRLDGTPVLTPPQRALESATVASVGALTDWHDTQGDAVYQFWHSTFSRRAVTIPRWARSGRGCSFPRTTTTRTTPSSAPAWTVRRKLS